MIERTTCAHLQAALLHSYLWVRLGAARALAGESEAERTILLEHWQRVRHAQLVGSEDSTDRVVELIALASCLEWSEVDSAPLLLEALGGSLQRVLDLMDGDWDPFVTYLNDKTSELPAGLPYRARRLFIDLRRSRLWRKHKAQKSSEREEPPMTPYENAVWELKHDSMHTASDGELDTTFSGAKRGLLSGSLSDRTAAIHELVRVAFTDSRWYIRRCAGGALSYLGTESSHLLISVLREGVALTLSDADAERLSQETHFRGGLTVSGMGELARGRLKKELLVYLASDLLSEFTDADTAAALAELVAFGDGIEADRARYVLLRMRVDVCVPALFWECVNAPLPELRERAYSVLSQVLDGSGRGEHHQRAVGAYHQRLDPTTPLEWILELAKSCQALPDWATDAITAGSLSWSRNRPATRLLLPSALRLTPQIEGESRVDIWYSTPPFWDRFTGYFERVRDVRRSSENASTLLPRRPMVGFPSRCLLASPVTLSVRLAVEMAGEAKRRVEFSVPIEESADHTDLLVVVESTGFTIEPAYAVLRVPRGEDSIAVRFNLVSTRLGSQLVELSFFRGTERIGYCTVSTEVVDSRATNQTALGLGVDSVQAAFWAGFNDEDLHRRGLTRAVVFVDSNADGALEFKFLDPLCGPQPVPIGHSPKQISLSQVSDWVAQQSALVRSFLTDECSSSDDLQGAVMGLRAIGCSLYEQLVPAAFTPILDRLPDGATVAIESNAHWVPWELLATRAAGPLLGERFQLIRIPRRPVLCADEPIDGVPLESTVDPGLAIQEALAVTGDNILSDTETQADLKEEIFGVAAPIVRHLVEGTLPALHTAVVDADLIHFTCHGRSPPYHLSLGPGNARRFFIPQVRTLSLKPGAMVFINACNSAQSTLTLAEMENFGFEFYLRGARPFLGTLGPVPKSDAQCMARLFYASFIGEGLAAGDALAKAKREAAKILKRPTWMFYCLVGPASVRRLSPVLGKCRTSDQTSSTKSP